MFPGPDDLLWFPGFFVLRQEAGQDVIFDFVFERLDDAPNLRQNGLSRLSREGLQGLNDHKPIHDRVQLVEPDFQQIGFIEKHEGVDNQRFLARQVTMFPSEFPWRTALFSPPQGMIFSGGDSTINPNPQSIQEQALFCFGMFALAEHGHLLPFQPQTVSNPQLREALQRKRITIDPDP